MLSSNAAWAIRYVIAVVLTLLLFTGLREITAAPFELQCAEAGGQIVPHVRNSLCVDGEGHVIILDE